MTMKPFFLSISVLYTLYVTVQEAIPLACETLYDHDPLEGCISGATGDGGYQRTL